MPPSGKPKLPPSTPGSPKPPSPIGIGNPPQPRIATDSSPQQTVVASEPMPGKIPEPPIWQVSSPVHAMQPQLASVFATQPMLPQQLSPGSPPIPNVPGVGAVQARPAAAQVQVPELHSGALGVQLLPQAPQFTGSVCVSMQAPPQQD